MCAKGQRGEWFLLAVSFWRDFAFERQLETTQSVFDWIVKGISK
jgi:hypothetical protein